MLPNHPSQAPLTLSDLLDRWETLRKSGEDVTPEELCRDHPHLLDELKRRIDLGPVPTLQAPTDTNSPTSPRYPTYDPAEGPPVSLPERYERLGLVGQGGFGQ